jgi:hypothetical protein
VASTIKPRLEAGTGWERVFKVLPYEAGRLEMFGLDTQKDIFGNPSENQFMWSDIKDKKKKAWVTNELKESLITPNIYEMQFKHKPDTSKIEDADRATYKKIFETGEKGEFVGGLSDEGRKLFMNKYRELFVIKFNNYYDNIREKEEKRLRQNEGKKENIEELIKHWHSQKITDIMKRAREETEKYYKIIKIN